MNLFIYFVSYHLPKTFLFVWIFVFRGIPSMCDFNRYWDNVAGICRGKFIYITNNILQTMCVKHGGQSVRQLHVEKNIFFYLTRRLCFKKKIIFPLVCFINIEKFILDAQLSIHFLQNIFKVNSCYDLYYYVIIHAFNKYKCNGSV